MRLRDVVRNEDQRGVAPNFACAGEQRVPLFEIESAKWLVQNREPDIGTQQRTAQAHALAFAARDQAAAFAERSF